MARDRGRTCLGGQGPTRTLIGAVAYLPWVLIGRRDAYRSAYGLMRRLIAVGEDRHYEPDLSEAQLLDAFLSHWIDPLEEQASRAWRAREALIRAGEMQAACYSS